MTELEMMANEEARHGNREALERLEAELREARLTELSALGQAQEAYEAQQRLEAKLAKAVEALQQLVIEYDEIDLAYDEPKSMTAAYGVALATLAELTGSKE